MTQRSLTSYPALVVGLLVAATLAPAVAAQVPDPGATAREAIAKARDALDEAHGSIPDPSEPGPFVGIESEIEKLEAETGWPLRDDVTRFTKGALDGRTYAAYPDARQEWAKGYAQLVAAAILSTGPTQPPSPSAGDLYSVLAYFIDWARSRADPDALIGFAHAVLPGGIEVDPVLATIGTLTDTSFVPGYVGSLVNDHEGQGFVWYTSGRAIQTAIDVPTNENGKKGELRSGLTTLLGEGMTNALFDAASPAFGEARNASSCFERGGGLEWAGCLKPRS